MKGYFESCWTLGLGASACPVVLARLTCACHLCIESSLSVVAWESTMTSIWFLRKASKQHRILCIAKILESLGDFCDVSWPGKTVFSKMI